MAPDLSSPEKMVSAIKKETGLIIEDGKIPLLLGGEHTITVGALQAFKDKGKDMSVICFDAHTDTRDEFFGAKYMHATVMARAKELYPDTFQVGIRSVDPNHGTIRRDKMLFMDDIQSLGVEESVSRLLDNTKENVYLSFDFDVFDPSEMPS